MIKVTAISKRATNLEKVCSKISKAPTKVKVLPLSKRLQRSKNVPLIDFKKCDVGFKNHSPNQSPTTIFQKSPWPKSLEISLFNLHTSLFTLNIKDLNFFERFQKSCLKLNQTTPLKRHHHNLNSRSHIINPDSLIKQHEKPPNPKNRPHLR